MAAHCAEYGFIIRYPEDKIEEIQEQVLKAEEAEHYATRYRLMWPNVKYEPGELKVVVYDKTGKAAGEKVIRTAGKPSRLSLQCDRKTIEADGQDLSFITVSLTDENGTLIPDAADALTFSVTGNGVFQAVCNGDATSLESFTEPTMKLFHGQLVMPRENWSRKL